MNTSWQLVAFPLILPWRPEFWTLPLFFPSLKVGVIPGWPQELTFQGMPLPPQANAPTRELGFYQPGELRQWKAFQDYQESREDTAAIIRQLRGEPLEPQPVGPISGDPWTLAWQLERMQADQEAQLLLVDNGQKWLADILAPEPWEARQDFGPAPGLKEMVDPELARLRYLLWQRIMGPQVTHPWAPFLLGRTSRAVFGALENLSEWQQRPRVQVSLPGCRSQAGWRALQGSGSLAWLPEFSALLSACLNAADNYQDLHKRAQELAQWLQEVVAPNWPLETAWTWDLEIWAADPDEEQQGPIISWLGAGADILQA